MSATEMTSMDQGQAALRALLPARDLCQLDRIDKPVLTSHSLLHSAAELCTQCGAECWFAFTMRGGKVMECVGQTYS